MKRISFIAALAFILLISRSVAFAWSNPTANPAAGAGVIYIESGTPANSFYIKSNGNVGIGTTNPTDLLYINAVANSGNGLNIGGVFRLRNSTASNHFVLEHLAVTGDLYIRSDSDGAGVDTGNIIINDQGGNVGIGTNGPTEKLDVTGNIKASGTITATSFSGGLSGTVSAANVSVGTFGANTGGGNYIFPANLTVGSPTGTLTANGNITALGGDFISNTTGAQGYPDLRLQGSGTEVIARNDGGRLWLMTATTGSMRVNLSDAYDNDRGLSLTYAPGSPAASPTGTFDIGQTQKNHATYYSHGITRLYTNGLERVRIDASGNVGIGTSSPGVKLEVAGAVRGGVFNTAQTNAGEAWFGRASDRTLGTYTLQLGGSTAVGTKFEIVDRAWSKVMYSFSGEAPAATLLVNASGNVGIGASPTAGLDVRRAITAATGVATGTNLQQTLTASANNDTLTALKINPTFVPGAYTGVTTYAIDATGTIKATAFEGGLSGTVSAANVSSGQFGANTGGGNYIFPAGVNAAGPVNISGLIADRIVATDINKNLVSTISTANLQLSVSSATGTAGSLVFSSSPTLSTPVIANIRGGTAASSTLTLRSTSGAGTSDAVIFQTGSSQERMRIDTTGKVGIGVTPQYQLHVGSFGALTARFGNADTDTVEIGAGNGKLNVGTIDPLYTIGGERYATFVAAMTGVKEETAGVVSLRREENRYAAKLDVKSAEKGSDLWLLYQTTDFGDNWNNLAVLLTANFSGSVWYEKDPVKKVIYIYGEPSKGFSSGKMEVSYRLTAPRFDHEKWSNISDEPSEGFKLDIKE